MQIFIILLALTAMVNGEPVVKTWTLNELSDALETNSVDTEMRPYLEDALNQIMLALYTGTDKDSIQMLVPSPSGHSTWTVEELERAMNDRSQKYSAYITQAYHRTQYNHELDRVEQNDIKVYAPALDISTWTLSDLNAALKSSTTNPDLRPYLNEALKKLTNGSEKRKKISMVTPIGLVTSKGANQPIYRAPIRT